MDSIAPYQEEWLRFGWESFDALNWLADNNWPEVGNGGKSNMDISLTQTSNSPTAWHT